jgi:anaerobic dimethyl sulfoxide reductase subunit B (iron-sulfur subunit)
MAKQLGFYVNLADCTGCKACEIACKDRKDLPLGVRWRRVYEYGGGEWIQGEDQLVPSGVFHYFVSTACMHCENPICMEVCPASAISKRDDGIVVINPDQCIGCRYCSWACPYGAPQFNEEAGVMTKCDFCVELQAKGENPACVDACPYRALEYGDIEELKVKHGELNDPAPMPDPSLTDPAIVYTPHKDTRTSQFGGGSVLNIDK